MNSNRYTEERYRQSVNSSIFGLVMTLLINVLIVGLCRFNGLKYIYPPPEEKAMVIDFEELEAPRIIKKKYGRQPSAENADPKNKVEYVQKAQAQIQGTAQNVTREATVGTEGDVEIPEPPREDPIDNLSLFHSPKNSNKDTLAPHTSSEVSDALKAGHAKGNIEKGTTDGTPTARVKGRSTVGVPKKPSYDIQDEGVIVVEVWVNRQGTVEKAIPGAPGTTVSNSKMWNAARNAALETKFNINLEDPSLVRGTITYIFKLK